MKHSRRNFLFGTVGLTTLLVSPVCALAVNGSLIVSYRFVDGRNVVFRELDATDGGAYADPSGAFVQDHKICRNPLLPTVTVHFCRDRATNPRPEVWVYHGTLYAQRPADLPEHTVTISDGTGVLHTTTLRYHGHRRWWRWQSQGPRPILRDIQYLLTHKWIPPYDLTLKNVSHPDTFDGTYIFPPAPMDNSGIMKYMPNVGERNDIGPVTGEQAKHIFNGNNWNNVLAQAEAAAAIPFHWIDEKTGAPVNIYNNPDIQNITPGIPGYIDYTKAGVDPEGGDNGWTLDYAHMPCTVALPAMMTGDPFYVLMAQGAVSYWGTKWARWPVPGDFSVGPHVDTQVRGHAWRLRDYLVAWITTPDTVPSWMNPKSYFAHLLAGTAAYWRYSWFDHPTPVLTNFHLTLTVDNDVNFYDSAIREAFHAAMIYWAVRLKAPANWGPLFTWKVDQNVAMSTGRDGYPRQYCAPYVINGNCIYPSTTWGQVYNAEVANGLWVAVNPSNPHMVLTDGGGQDWWFANQVLAALEVAVAAGIPNAKAGRDYVASEVDTRAGRFGKWAWTSNSALALGTC